MSGLATSPTGEPVFLPPLCAIFRRHLKKQRLKFTTERALILDAVLARQGVFEADDLVHDLARDHADQRVSKATVYRTLKHLREAGILDEVLLDNTRARYQLAYGRTPVAHLVDEATGRVVAEVSTAELRPFIDRVCEDAGYTAASHRLVIYATRKG